MCLTTCLLYVDTVGNGIGQAIEVVFIVFLTAEFSKKKSDLQHAYYYISYISYVIDTLGNVSVWTVEMFPENTDNWLSAICLAFPWFIYFEAATWSFMLSLNRCTALAFPTFHNKIWNGLWLKFAIALMLIYPFLVNGYTLFDAECRLRYKQPECRDYYSAMTTATVISTTCLALLSMLLIIFAVCKSHGTSTSSKKAVIERRMILHTTLSSVMLILWIGTVYMGSVIAQMSDFFSHLSFIVYMLQHYPPMVLIVVINPIFRRLFFNFTRIHKLLRKQDVAPSIVTTTAKNCPLQAQET
uniref:Serpentine receptor class gamma n=1 Tax=Panagrellus redivivus TaxID=6233 RepID=A0A7E4ZWC3_PANRE